LDLNETDVKILKNLLDDARLSSRQIAKNVGVSVGTVLSRIKKMEDEGLIKGYTVTLDHEKLGYQLTVVTEITVSKGRLLEMELEIAKISGVCGRLMCCLKFENYDEAPCPKKRKLNTEPDIDLGQDMEEFLDDDLLLQEDDD
jgi:DNA-binding Lrp family transcriptional regulator